MDVGASPPLGRARRWPAASGRSPRTRPWSSVSDDGYAQLASTIPTGGIYAGAHVLICWHHRTIPALAAALGAADAPVRWPDAQYDHVWQLRYGRGAITFDDRLAPLLPGDRAPEDLR